MSLCRPLSYLRCLVGRPIHRASPAVFRPHLTFAPSSTSHTRTFNTSSRWCVEDGSSSSSESESSTESETESTTKPDGVLGPNEEEDNRAAVMKACLRFVRELGWSNATLKEGAKSAGFDGEESTLFPDGPGELVNLFEKDCNDRLYVYMEKLKEASLEGSEVIRPSVEHRLRMLSPYIDKWPQAMALKAFPPVMPTSLETLSLMVDDMWYCAGDRSTDINWYSKRALLAAVYTSTEFYMVQDGSEDFEDTWKFLDNRLQGLKDVSKSTNQLEGVGRGVLDFLCAGLANVRGRGGNEDEAEQNEDEPEKK